MIHILVKTGAMALVALLGLGVEQLVAIGAASAQQAAPAQQQTVRA